MQLHRQSLRFLPFFLGDILIVVIINSLSFSGHQEEKVDIAISDTPHSIDIKILPAVSDG